MELNIIIPTFNEKNNIGLLLEKIFKLSNNIKIIIVDDSPDQDIKEIIRQYKNVHYIHRDKKSGRGSAVIVGMNYALKNFSCRYLIEMDADLSHEPNEIISNLNYFLNEDIDLLISSRYLMKSKIINWPLQRKLLSFFANNLAKNILKVPITDYTNGFRIYSNKAAKHVTTNCGKVGDGFIILSEILVQLYYNNFNVKEIESTFVNRTRGESSVTFREIFKSLVGLYKIYKLKNKLKR
tara:strand:- start:1079 stop:1792 length:714 start_codon:yes stop_codon:yes gene_type:complete